MSVEESDPMARPQNPAPASPGKTPRLARGGRKATLQLPPLPPFLLVAHPARWAVIEGRVLPSLHEFKLESGVNGCLAVKDPDTGETVFDIDGCEANLKSKGAIPLDWEIDGAPYLREVAPGKWLSRWQHLTPGGHIVHDTAGFAKWVAELQEQGKLPQPSVHDLDQLEAVVRYDLDAARKSDDAHRARQLERQLKAIDAERPAAEERLEAFLARQGAGSSLPAPGGLPRLAKAELAEKMRAGGDGRLERLPDEVVAQGGSIGGDEDQVDPDDKPKPRSRRKAKAEATPEE